MGLQDIDNAAFLGIESSITGKRWIEKPFNERQAMMLSQRLGLSEIIGRLITARGVEYEEAEPFLDPKLRNMLPDPSSLSDMDAAAERISSAIMMDEKIGIFGDYDVDGATSSALLTRFFRATNGQSVIYIPDRVKEGYGPNVPALLGLKKLGVSLIVTVDCGTLAVDTLKVATDAGLDIVVVDHHVAEPKIPSVSAVVNPNRLDDESNLGELAAVGVCFLLVVAVNRVLRQAGWYKSRVEPDLMQWLDIVALGTICDVVPLKGLNRALVFQGLRVLSNQRNLGLKALSQIIELDEMPNSYHLGYLLGPRINAGGRVGAPDLGARLLSTEDFGEATEIAFRLEEYNSERKLIEERVLQEAVEQVIEKKINSSCVLAVGNDWHPGVIGIVASRLRERFNRPAFVISINEEIRVGIGSSRSVAGFDIGAKVISARQLGLLESGGGHKMAAGFKITEEKIDGFRQFLDDKLGEGTDLPQIKPEIEIEGSVSAHGINNQLISEIEQLGPFGAGNPEPIFVVPNAHLGFANVVGESHIRVGIKKDGGGELAGIVFRAVGTPQGDVILKNLGDRFHVAGKLRINRWRGRETPQIQIEDLALAE